MPGYWPWSPPAAERLTHQTASLPRAQHHRRRARRSASRRSAAVAAADPAAAPARAAAAAASRRTTGATTTATTTAAQARGTATSDAVDRFEGKVTVQLRRNWVIVIAGAGVLAVAAVA